MEQKSLLKLSDVRSIKVPKFDELSVKNLFDRFKEDETIMKYMPNKTADGKLPDRTYFFNLLNTVYPEIVSKMIINANK